MKHTNYIIPLSGGILFCIFLWLTWHWFDKDEFIRLMRAVGHEPQWLLIMFLAYLFSFMLKAVAWRSYVGARQQEPFRIFYHGIIYSLLVNHLLPLKVGDLVRTGILVKAARQPWDEALHSVAIMRFLDMLVLGLIAGCGIVWIGLPASWMWITAMLAGAAMLTILYKLPGARAIPFIGKHLKMVNETMLSGKGLFIFAAVALSWVLEAGVIYGIARLSSLSAGVGPLIWANSMTIAGQVFHVTPGGIGTYESTLSGTLVLLGISGKEAYAAAVMSHTFKFMFSFSVGAYSVIRMPIQWHEMRAWMKKRNNSEQPIKEMKRP
jgi:uncharacterized membrane protein YbhN (UPF0104 family)